MSILNEKDFVKKIKDNNINNIMFFFGNEKYLIDYYSKSIVLKLLNKNINDLNFTEYDMENIDLDIFDRESSNISFFSTIKCIHLKYFDASSLNKTKLDRITEILSNATKSTYFIITVKNCEDGYKKDEKLQKIIKSFSKNFDCIELVKKTSKDLVKFIITKCKKENIEISQQNAIYLIENCSDSIDSLTQEIDKLIAFTGENNEITQQSIEKLASFKTESEIFLMVSDIFNMREENAYKRLNNLFYNNEEPVAILSVITSNLIDLYRAKTALFSTQINNYEAMIIEDFSYQRNLSFKIKNAMRDCKNFSIKYLREVIILALQTDIEFKSLNLDNKIILQTFITKLMVLPR